MLDNELRIVSTYEMLVKQDVVATPINDLVKVYNLCIDMHSLCCKHNGAGLSVIQVGVPWKLFVVYRSSSESEFYVDCVYEPASEIKKDSIEGCLSFLRENDLSRLFVVSRFDKVRVRGWQLMSYDKLALEPIDKIVEGYEGIVFQHEIDHQFGIVIADIGREVTIWRG